MRGLRQVCFGLLSGTFGFAPRGKGIAIHLSTRRGRKRGFFHFAMTGANDLVSTRRVYDVFSHFCGVSVRRTKSNVKLTLIGTFIRVRNNAVRMRDSRQRKAVFAMRLPMYGYASITSALSLRMSRRSLPIRFSRSRRRRRPNCSSSEVSMLVVSSGTSVHSCIRKLLGTRCSIVRTTGNSRNVQGTVGCIPSLVVSSIVVPNVSNVRYYHQLGDRLRAYRVPIVLLATYSLSRRHVRNCSNKTSSCVSGPFDSRLLLTHVHGLVSSRRQLGRFFNSQRALTGRSVYSLSGSFIRGFGGVVRRGVDSSKLGMRSLKGSVKLDHIRLCHGVGSLAGCTPGRLLHVTHLGQTTSLLTSSRLAITRVTCRINFASPSCFAGYCGRRFKRDPARFLGHGKWEGKVGSCGINGRAVSSTFYQRICTIMQSVPTKGMVSCKRVTTLLKGPRYSHVIKHDLGRMPLSLGLPYRQMIGTRNELIPK